MQTIFVMVKCELGQTYDVAGQAVDRVERLSDVHSFLGQYDVMMKCHLEDGHDIGHFVTEEVQRLAGVKDTFTLIAFKSFS